MKEWVKPVIEELDVTATSYSTKPGTRQDGVYVSTDGKYEIPTYGPSGKNDGVPSVDVTPNGPEVSVD